MNDAIRLAKNTYSNNWYHENKDRKASYQRNYNKQQWTCSLCKNSMTMGASYRHKYTCKGIVTKELIPTAPMEPELPPPPTAARQRKTRLFILEESD